MQRHLGLDLARGFTVLFIPVIHSVMIFGNSDTHKSFLVSIFSFIAEWPGAQVLMFLMGINLALSKKSSPYFLKRAFQIFIAGYVLNFLKFGLPDFVDALPKSFSGQLVFVHDRSFTQMPLIGDIFQFAGLAIFVMSWIKLSKYGALIAVLLGYIVLLISPLLWDQHHSNIVADHFLHLIGGKPDDVFFPLFPWLVYPLIGLGIGCYLQMPFASFTPVFVSGCFMMAAIFLARQTAFHFPDTAFYRTYPDMTLMHLGFVMAWISGWAWISKIIRKKSLTGTVLCFCSRNITSIYVIQWVLICWLMCIVEYGELNIEWSAIIGISVTVMVLLLSRWYSKTIAL